MNSVPSGMNSVPACSDCSECSDLLSASTRVRARADGLRDSWRVNFGWIGCAWMEKGNHCIHCIRCTEQEKCHCQACDQACSTADGAPRSSWRQQRLDIPQRQVMSCSGHLSAATAPLLEIRQ